MNPKFDKFKIDVLRKVDGIPNQKAVDYIAYCEFTDEELLIPMQAPEGHEAYMTNSDGSIKNIGQYAALGNGNIRRLAPIHGNTYRNDVLSIEALIVWDMYLSQGGKGVDAWLTREEFIALTANEEEEI